MSHLRGLIQRYDNRRQQLSDDTKHEVRWPAKKRRRLVKSGRARAERQHARITTAIQQAVAQTVGYCVRQKCGVVHYNDSCRDFLASFRWYALKERMKQKCNEAGLTFVAVGTTSDSS